MDSVLCAAFDSRRLISGSMDRSLRIWDVRSGQSIHKLYGHKVIIGSHYMHVYISKSVQIAWRMKTHV